MFPKCTFSFTEHTADYRPVKLVNTLRHKLLRAMNT